MARCKRCNKRMIFSSPEGGYCRKCSGIVLREREEQKRLEDERRQREEERERREAEESLRREEKARRLREEAEQKRRAEADKPSEEDREEMRRDREPEGMRTCRLPEEAVPEASVCGRARDTGTQRNVPLRAAQEGPGRGFGFYTKVVGVTFKNDDGSDRQRIIRDLMRSGQLKEGSELRLVPEPENPYDANCIRVLSENGLQIGCLSREVAARTAPNIRRGVLYRAFVECLTGGDVGYAYGLNIRIERAE